MSNRRNIVPVKKSHCDRCAIPLQFERGLGICPRCSLVCTCATRHWKSGVNSSRHLPKGTQRTIMTDLEGRVVPFQCRYCHSQEIDEILLTGIAMFRCRHCWIPFREPERFTTAAHGMLLANCLQHHHVVFPEGLLFSCPICMEVKAYGPITVAKGTDLYWCAGCTVLFSDPTLFSQAARATSILNLIRV